MHVKRLAFSLLALGACHGRKLAAAEHDAAALVGGAEFVRCAGTHGDGCANSYGDGYICALPASGRAIHCPGDERKPCYLIPMGTMPAERGR